MVTILPWPPFHAEATGKSKLLIKEEGILAGVDVAKQVYRQLDPSVHFEIVIHDGTACQTR